MKTVTTLCAVFLVWTSFAQMTLEVNPEPKPFDSVISQLFPELKTPMRSVTWISAGDTLKKYVADAAGNLVEDDSYESNKRTFTTFNTYAGKLKMRTVTRTAYDETVTTYAYNPDGKITERYPKRTVFDKKIVTSDPNLKSVFEYDATGNLVSNYRIDDTGVKMGITTYTYDGEHRLIKTMTNQQWESVFEYDAAGNLLKRTESLNGSVARVHRYAYDAHNNLLSMQIGSNYKVEFTYENQRIVKAVYTLSSGKQEVIDLTYNNDGLLTGATIRRNDWMSFSPFNLRREYERAVPYTFRVELLRDDHNNTNELKYYVDNTYKYSEKFLISYY